MMTKANRESDTGFNHTHEYNIFFQHYQSVISLRFDTHHSPCFGSCLLTLSVCIAGL